MQKHHIITGREIFNHVPAEPTIAGLIQSVEADYTIRRSSNRLMIFIAFHRGESEVPVAVVCGMFTPSGMSYHAEPSDLYAHEVSQDLRTAFEVLTKRRFEEYLQAKAAGIPAQKIEAT